jgi:predicted SprT family Zn-dependent metalloprotease
MNSVKQPLPSKSTAEIGDLDAFGIARIPDDETRALAQRYADLFELAGHRLWISTDRRAFEQYLGRRVGSGIGGAYVYHRARKLHAILINLPRIDRTQPKAVELVVAEEFMHMRDWIDGDRRRHAKHGYDRIAVRVAEVTGATLEEVRSCLKPVSRRPARYVYRCPGCQRTIERSRRGTWSCGRCSSKFDPRYVFQLELDRRAERPNNS